MRLNSMVDDQSDDFEEKPYAVEVLLGRVPTEALMPQTVSNWVESDRNKIDPNDLY
jgi:hypothetical protein